MIHRFYGSSDDNFIVDGDARKDEIGCYDRPACYRVTDEDGNGCLVTGFYPLKGGEEWPGCWSVGIMPLDEDKPLPSDWKVRFDLHSNGYSSVMTLETPGSVKVESWVEVEETSKGWR